MPFKPIQSTSPAQQQSQSGGWMPAQPKYIQERQAQFAGQQAPGWGMKEVSQVGRGVAEAGTGALKGFTEGTANILAAAGRTQDVLSGGALASKITGQPSMTEIGAQQIQAGGKWLGEQPEIGMNKLQRSMGSVNLNRNSGASQLGQFAGNMAAQTIPSLMLGGGNVLSKPATTWGGKLMESIGRGAIGTELAVASNEGRPANIGELATGAGIDVGASLAGAALKKVGQGIYTGLGVTPEASSIKQFDRRAQKAIDMNMVGTNRMINAKGEKILKNSSKELKSILKKGENIKTSPTKLLDGVVDIAEEARTNGNVAKADAIIDFAANFEKGSKALSPTDILGKKQYAAANIATQLRNVDLSDPSKAAQKIVYEQIWKNADKELANIGKAVGAKDRVKELTQNMSAAYSVMGPAEKRVLKGGWKPNAFDIKSVLPITPLATTIGAGAYKLGKAAVPLARLTKNVLTRTKILSPQSQQ